MHMPSDWQDVEVEHGTIRLGVTSQGSPVESRYLTSAYLPINDSAASRGPALVFAPFLSSPHAVESCISESPQSHTYIHTCHTYITYNIHTYIHTYIHECVIFKVDTIHPRENMDLLAWSHARDTR